MGRYRILWTREGTEGGWFADVEAPDAATAAWSQAVSAAAAADQERPPQLIGISDITPA